MSEERDRLVVIEFTDGDLPARFEADMMPQGLGIGIGDPPGFVHVFAEGRVHYFPVGRIAHVEIPINPKKSENVSAD